MCVYGRSVKWLLGYLVMDFIFERAQINLKLETADEVTHNKFEKRASNRSVLKLKMCLQVTGVLSEKTYMQIVSNLSLAGSRTFAVAKGNRYTTHCAQGTFQPSEHGHWSLQKGNTPTKRQTEVNSLKTRWEWNCMRYEEICTRTETRTMYPDSNF